MSTPDGRFTLSFNGEIYNFRELRAGLAARGVAFRTQTDTEVLLRLYEREGAVCLDRLRGMFAFAVWDQREGTCLLARDPLGIKPLYYCERPGELTFASEVRALLASGRVGKELDVQGVFGYLQTGTVPEPRTLLRGVRMLPAGSWLLWRDGQSTGQTYWRVRFPADAAAGADAAGRVRAALLDSVRAHFVSDVPVGVFLSGGIDSTALVALSRAVGQQDLRTFSIGFHDPALDESDAARRTAAHFHTCHTEWRLAAAEGKRLFHDYLARLDQPTIDGFNTFTVAKLAREQGMKVVLSGVGGDELFGGYATFRQVPRLARWGRRLEAVPPARALLAGVLRRSGRAPLRRLGEFLTQPATVLAAYRTYRGIFPASEARALTLQLAGVAPENAEPPPVDLEQPTPKDAVSAMALQLYMRNQLLRDSDVMSMAWGLELRVPLVDRTLFESVAAVPASLRLRAGKRMLVEAVPEVPEWVWRRPKRAFLFPMQQWIADDWREVFAGVVARHGGRAPTWYQQWALFVLDFWRRQHGIQP